MRATSLRVKNLIKYFHEPETNQVLKGVTFDVQKGEFLSIVGKFGPGKSTMLYVLSTMDTDYDGSLEVNGDVLTGKSQQELSAFRNEHIGFILYAQYQLPFGIKTTCDFQTGAADYVTFDTTGVRGYRKPDGSLPDVSFMHIKPGNTKLIDQGTIDAGVSYSGSKPDVECFETSGLVGVTEAEKVLPKTFALAQNYPNPFNPNTTIQYSVPKESSVTLEVYSLLGQRIATLVNGRVSTGNHNVDWNAAHAASGLYFYRITANSLDGTNAVMVSIVRKMVLNK